MGKKPTVVVLDPSKLFPEFVVSFLCFGFFIATVAYPLKDSDTPRSAFLIIYLIVVSILSGAAGVMRYVVDRSTKGIFSNDINDLTRQWSGIVKSFLQPSRTTFQLLHGPACILHLYLTARLYAVDNFQTHPTNLDFGPKYGDSSESAEQNIAFEAELNSFGHALQGFLAALLSFPAVSGWLARKIGCIGMEGSVHAGRARFSVSVTTLLYTILTIYPVYNLIKRLNKNSRVFASTSFVNNAMEWTMGYVLGLALGMLFTSLMRRSLVIIYPREHGGGLDVLMKSFDVSVNSEHKYAFGKLEEYAWTPQSDTCLSHCRAVLCDISKMDCFTIVTVISNMFLSLFTISVLIAGIYLGATWNKCLEEDGDGCINSTENGVDIGQKLIVAFALTFMAIQMVFTAILIRMHGPLI